MATPALVRDAFGKFSEQCKRYLATSDPAMLDEIWEDLTCPSAIRTSVGVITDRRAFFVYMCTIDPEFLARYVDPHCEADMFLEEPDIYLYVYDNLSDQERFSVRDAQKNCMRTLFRKLYYNIPEIILYDLVRHMPRPMNKNDSLVLATMYKFYSCKLRPMILTRALGWSWERRHHFHPVQRRWATAFLTLANVAEREGHPLGTLPLEILYRIINGVLQSDDSALFLTLDTLDNQVEKPEKHPEYYIRTW
jgi:hypothetical protein